jgi:U3 small nucleolar RNA-associated protein 12
MEHTYLRYECADSFGIVSSASPKVPATDANIALLDNILLTTAGSCCVGYHLRTNLPVLKLAHAEQSGGIGTGRALNSEEIVCLDVAMAASSPKVATGWVDGAVRVFFDIDDSAKDLVHSLLYDKSELQEPLVLNGHNGPVRVVAFDKNDVSRLASGGSDGSVVIWDVLDEKGLFRLLGHRGGITSIKFLRLSGLDGLVTTSLDSLIKIWNIQGQCCTQTIASHRGEVWGADLGSLWTEYGEESNNRWRLISGGDDGQLRVWSVKPPKRASMAESDFAERETEPDDLDSVCFFMGLLTPPPHIAASSEKIFSVQFHPSCRYVAVLRSNSKSIDVFVVRGVKESSKRRQRRLKRRIEKQKKKEESDVSWSSKKRGILDDDESSDDEQGDVAEGDERDIDPEAVKATDEFEYLTTVRCSHKIKSFRFLLQKEKKEVTRLVCALATNALETYAITRKIDR